LASRFRERFLALQLFGDGERGSCPSATSTHTCSYLIGDLRDNFGTNQRPVVGQKFLALALISQAGQLLQQVLPAFRAVRFGHLKPFFSRA